MEKEKRKKYKINKLRWNVWEINGTGNKEGKKEIKKDEEKNLEEVASYRTERMEREIKSECRRGEINDNNEIDKWIMIENNDKKLESTETKGNLQKTIEKERNQRKKNE